MRNSLPIGWVEISPLEISEKIRGVSYDKSEATRTPKKNYLPILRANNIDDNEFAYNDLVFVPTERVSDNQKLQKGDVVIAMSSGSKSVVGKTAQLNNSWDGSFGAFCGVLRPNKQINSKYFGYYFQSKEYRNLVSELAGGTNINNLKNEHFDEIRFPLAPLAEQHRIVAKLDALLARVTNCKNRLEKIPALLKNFRQSVLAAAISGELTKECNGENEKNLWQLKTVGEIGEVSGGITLNSKRKHLKLQFPYLRVANVYANELWLDEIKIIGVVESEIKRTLLKQGDLLIVEGNGSIDQIGRVAIWNNEVENCLHQNHLIKVRFKNAVTAKYVLYYLLSPAGREQIEAVSTSTSGLNTLSISKVSKLEIDLPPIEEQKEIVRKVEELFHFADSVEARYQKAKAWFDKLPQAILAKAFRGELVEQDENDEPASVLLERIKKEKQNTNKPKPTAKRKKIYEENEGVSLAAEE